MEEQNNQESNVFKASSSNYRRLEPIREKSSSGGFGKSIILPFFSGVFASFLVLGVCFGVPGIRTHIAGALGVDSRVVSEKDVSNSDDTDIIKNSVNTNLVSLNNYSDTAIGVAKKVRPSIVGIKVEYTVNSLFSKSQSASAQGSGVIISEDGYILTNNHVINSSSDSSFYELGKANKVTVYLYDDDTSYEATVIGTDEQTDLAVIKIDKTELPAAELGDSDSVQVGEFSMAIGNPLGMESSVSGGIISGVNRRVTDSDGKTYTLIQTDAAINSGNSGGALVNSRGQVIGINTIKMSGTGIEGMGFAIPINSTKEIYEQLIQYSKVKRPYIGITGINLDEKTAEFNHLVVGVYVKSIDDFSAAEKAGVKVGDVIVEVEGKKITTMDEINEIKNAHQIGDEITIKVNRDGKEIDLTIKLAEQP